LSAEVFFGGSARANVGMIFDLDDIDASEIDFTTALAPHFAASSGIFDFSVLADIRWNNRENSFTFSVEEFRLTLLPADFVLIKVGRFSYLPGTAEFFSNTNFFNQGSLVELISSVGLAAGTNADMVQANFFFSIFYTKLTISPIAHDMVFPDTISPLFPGHYVPKLPGQTMENTEYSGYTVDGASVTEVPYDKRVRPPFNFDQVSVSGEFGGTAGGIDFSLLYYYGWDDDMLFSTSTDHVNGTYTTTLVPEYYKIHALGLNLASSVGAFRFWGDAAWTINKTFIRNNYFDPAATTPLVNGTYTTTTLEGHFLEYTVGASYEFGFGLSVLCEYMDGWILDGDPSQYVQPTLSRVLAAAVNLPLFEYQLIPTIAAMYSIDTNAFGGGIVLTYAPTDELELTMTAPIFFDFDGATNPFGGNKFYLSLGLTWRF
jgi:hypothetical protein